MRWKGRSSPTRAASRCSRWGTAASLTRSRVGGAPGERETGAILAIDEEGVRFRSYLDGERAVPRPRDLDGDPGGAAARTSRSCSTSARPSTSPRLHRALDGAHPPLARALPALARRERARRPGRVRDRPGRRRARICGSSRWRGRGQRLRRDRDRRLARAARRRRCTRSSRGGPKSSSGCAPERPRHLLGIGDVDDLIDGVELGIDTFDCALPTRLARHGVALVPDPSAAGVWTCVKAPLARGAGADPRWLSVSRVLGRLLARVPALPPARRRADRRCACVTLHNLSFIARLMAGPARGDRRPVAARGGRARCAGGPLRALLRVLADQALNLVVGALKVVRDRSLRARTASTTCSGRSQRRSPPTTAITSSTVSTAKKRRRAGAPDSAGALALGSCPRGGGARRRAVRSSRGLAARRRARGGGVVRGRAARVADAAARSAATRDGRAPCSRRGRRRQSRGSAQSRGPRSAAPRRTAIASRGRCSWSIASGQRDRVRERVGDSRVELGPAASAPRAAA